MEGSEVGWQVGRHTHEMGLVHAEKTMGSISRPKTKKSKTGRATVFWKEIIRSLAYTVYHLCVAGECLWACFLPTEVSLAPLETTTPISTVPSLKL